MRCAIDTDLIGRNHSGNETFLRGLITGLPEADPDLFLTLIGGEPNEVEPLCTPQVQFVEAPAGPWGEMGFGWRAAAAEADASLSTYNAALGFRGLNMTIVHDVSYKKFPRTYPRLLRARIVASVARSVRVSDLIITVSEFSRSELLDAYPKLSESNVRVVYPAPNKEFTPQSVVEIERVRRKYELPVRFILAVGNLQPRKNLPRLAEAARRVGLPLVVVGQALWLYPDVGSQLGSGVHWLGYVPQGDLPGLYSACSTFAYPSLYEGYGLPVIEAMACGAPVVTSDDSALAEVAAQAAQLVVATSVESIAHGLKMAAAPSHAEILKEAGLQRAAQFTWTASAAALASVMRAKL